ncbi:hypothetical protein JTE90_016129 [Oedothorax gibbosus]|uniref:Uncharacterized protein n=1 Tax=Oedothorax gibbosus TaxID=931172 RepID=A0AAV6U7H9_9ARAC|nr:hypothetical protein JTE90_016129 [Oedothorax gibbosus]
MVDLNVVCRDLDSCRDNRTSDSLETYNCHCGPYCKDLDTCCIDSKFRPRWRQQPIYVAKCLPVYGRTDLSVFMVDECTKGWDSHFQEMCSSTGENRDDPFLAVPVTSLRSGMTYKNYYCAACNENPPEGQVAFWNVEVRGTSKSISELTDREIHYDYTQNSWTIQNDEVTWIPVNLTMQVPDSVQQAIRTCRTDGHVSTCSPDWKDASTAEKCSAYTALVNVRKDLGDSTSGRPVRYRNPHCAICNFEEAYALNCDETFTKQVELGVTRQTFFIGMFVLADEKRENKCNQGMVYDGLAKKCRRVRCRRNYTLKNGKCVPKSSVNGK